MAIKLIALDIDDTLLNSSGEILPSTVTAVKRAVEQGIKVVLCTGRPLAGVSPFLKELGIKTADQYVITYNGAVIESVTGKVVAKHLVSNHFYRVMTKFGQAHHIPFNVLDEHSVIYTADHNVDAITVVQAWENKAGLLIRTPDELPQDFEIAKGLFVGEEKMLDEVEPLVTQTFGKDLYVVRAARNFLELMNPAVSKGKALAELARKLEITKEEVMAVGDEGNDIAMFEAAGTAVSMGNGSELAKAHADYVTGSNDAGGLADAIKKFALN
ncbi:Cof-type HAD-IIB family hydrolase [Pediococcus siamensis]|uniref:Cof-type HAD-IIB family hydrolase n=1 Tax=Pediococcus siamensis TaxID=381829 RepID=UPI0039A3BFF6